MDERLLTEKLIGYDTSTPEGIKLCAGFVKGWLEARDIEARQIDGPRPAGDARRGRAARTRRRRVLLHGHLDVVPGRAEQFEPRRRRRPAVRARRLRHEGRAGGDAARAGRPARPGRGCGCGSGSSPTRSPRRRSSAAATCSSTRASSATSRSPASRPTCTSGSRPRACWRCGCEVDGRAAHGATPWLGENAILQGDRRFPRDRVATVCLAQLGAVRPAVDQPRPDPRRRRAEQGARHLLHRRRHPLPARAGPRRDPRGGRRDPGRRRSSRPSAGRPAIVDPDSPFVRALCATPPAPPRRRGDQRRPRRRLRRGLVPARRRAGGRVRAGRRRPPRARGVGLGRLAGQLPQRPGRLRRALARNLRVVDDGEAA